MHRVEKAGALEDTSLRSCLGKDPPFSNWLSLLGYIPFRATVSSCQTGIIPL